MSQPIGSTPNGINEAKREVCSHYFASSVLHWRVDNDIRELIRRMDKLGDKEYVVYRVPLSKESEYDIKSYRPAVEGAEKL